MRKLCTLAAVLVALLLASAAPLQAQFSLIPYVGYNLTAGPDFDEILETEDEDAKVGALLLGLGVEFALPLNLPVALSLRPSVEYYFLPGSSLSLEVFGESFEASISQSRLQISGDVIADFGAPGTFSPYAGAGLAWSQYTVSAEFEECINGTCFSESDSESWSGIGANVLGGIRLAPLGFGTPFVQVRYTILNIEVGPDPEDDFFDERERVDFNGFSIMGGIAIPIGGR